MISTDKIKTCIMNNDSHRVEMIQNEGILVIEIVFKIIIDYIGRFVQVDFELALSANIIHS